MVEEIAGNKFRAIQSKQISFECMYPKGYKMILATPKSRYYTQYGSGWIDLNKSQRGIIERYKDGFFVMRLENNNFAASIGQ